MIHVAILEDSQQDREILSSYIDRYGIETEQTFKTTEFTNAVTFLTNYRPSYDIVFVDIQMPHLNGMEAANKLRELDSTVPIVFVTNMANYAIKGYSVNAVDFVVKPVSYYNFVVMMNKVLRISRSRAAEVVLKTDGGAVRVRTDDILCVEVMDHQVIYHTDGGDIAIWETLKTQENKLEDLGFARCNNYCLVNLKYVDKISGCILTIGDREIVISRTKKKEFMQKLVKYYGKRF